MSVYCPHEQNVILQSYIDQQGKQVVFHQMEVV